MPQRDENVLLKIQLQIADKVGIKISDEELNLTVKRLAQQNNLDIAFELAQEVENICHQYINALRIGIPKTLSKKEMKIVLEKMKNYKKG